jgi:hypothetical protein
VMFPHLALAWDASNDTRKLSVAEQSTFMPVACQNPVAKNGSLSCDGILNYPDNEWGKDDTISFQAIAYGAFTRAGADQSYITYESTIEPHASNYGGGILFERDRGQWKLAAWYPGNQMDHCIALPSGEKLKMLCLTRTEAMGQTLDVVWTGSVPESPDDDSDSDAHGLLTALDERDTAAPNDQCTRKRAKDAAILLDISALKRSANPAFFAEASIRYATADDSNAACKRDRFAHVRTINGMAGLVLKDGQLTVTAPAAFTDQPAAR